MDDKELEKIKQAWLPATVDDIKRGLCHPHSVTTEVYTIIRAEAERRGLAAITVDDLQHFAQKKKTFSIKVFLRNHLYFSGFLLGLAMLGPSRLAWNYQQVIHPIFWLILLTVLPVVLMIYLLWPMVSYRAILVTGVLACIGSSVGNGILFLSYWDALRLFTIEQWMMALFISPAVAWFSRIVIVIIACWVRRKFWPLYPAGHCQRCGYDLTGLPSLRCPECGSTFEPIQARPISS